MIVAFTTYSDNDAPFFNVNDVLDFLPHGDEDNSTNGLVIQSISIGTNTITFTANHGITPGTNIGTLEPTTFINSLAGRSISLIAKDLLNRLKSSSCFLSLSINSFFVILMRTPELQ